jgi:hypothetical protein
LQDSGKTHLDGKTGAMRDLDRVNATKKQTAGGSVLPMAVNVLYSIVEAGNCRRTKSIPRARLILLQYSGQLRAGPMRIVIFRRCAESGEERAKEHLKKNKHRHNPDTQADPTEGTKNFVAHVMSPRIEAPNRSAAGTSGVSK